MLSGPMVGGNWEAGDPAPRSVTTAYWDVVCPESERHVIYSDELKNPVRNAPGREAFEYAVKVLKELPARCVQIRASEDDSNPQLFAVGLAWAARGRAESLLEHFLDTATSRLTKASALVLSAVEMNMPLLQPTGPMVPNASTNDPFERMMAVHIRRGDFEGYCTSVFVECWSTYYNW
jgi:hypothetical protein